MGLLVELKNAVQEEHQDAEMTMFDILKRERTESVQRAFTVVCGGYVDGELEKGFEKPNVGLKLYAIVSNHCPFFFKP